MMENALIPVLIADDDPGMRLILRKKVQATDGFCVIAEAANGEEAMALFEKCAPRVVFLDVDMPGKTGIECARLMLRHREGVSFLDITDILLIQREDRATVVYTGKNERYVLSETLSEMEEKLDPDIFFRCHKSYIINLRAIRDITPYGRWTYVVRLEGTEHDALITHEKYEELEQRFA